MKILTFRRFVGLAALGGFAYVHRQRGGEWTLASMKDTLRHLWSTASNKAEQVRDASRESLSRTPSTSSRSMQSGLSEDRGTGQSEDPSTSSYSNYGQRNDDRNRY